jgi:putative PIN family toxin of toxin-antitoxin system
MLRVVFDTNTIVSAIFWRAAPYQALQAVRQKMAVLLSTEALIAELADVLSRRKFSARLAAIQTTPDQLLSDFRGVIELVEPVLIPSNAVDDPDDIAVLACAVGGQADYIVTGDHDLLRIVSYQNIPVWTARQFCDFLERQNRLR